MARDGNGNYLLPPSNPVVTGTNISSSDFNTTMNDIRDALTQSLSKDGQTTPTANLPMGGNRHTGVSDATLTNQYTSAKQVQNGSLNTCTGVSNVVDAFAASINPPIAAYTDGQTVVMTPTVTTTTVAPTLALNGLGAKPIVKESNVACAIGDIVVNVPVTLRYSSQGSGSFYLLNPASITGTRVKAIPDTSLSANVPLLNAHNTFTQGQIISATVGQQAVVLNGYPLNFSMLVQGALTGGQSYGPLIQAGTNNADVNLLCLNAAGTVSYFQVRGDGAVSIPQGGLGVAGAVTGNLFLANVGASASAGLTVSATTGGIANIQVKFNGTLVGTLGATGLISGGGNGWQMRTDNGGSIDFSINAGASVNARIATSGQLQANDVSGGTLFDVGFREVPVNGISSGYTLVLTDRAKGISCGGSGGYTVTIPSNSAVAFPVGTVIMIDNPTAGNISVAINSDSLSQVGTNSGGTRTIGSAGQALLWKFASTGWRISGVNLS